MKLYRFLTGPDDEAFCRRVCEALEKDWELHGSPALTFDSATGRVIAGQALVKRIPGTYSADIDIKAA